ncbi:MAG: hypothetical protein WCR55_02565 [Lentisphaerota bacterium]
MYRYIKKTAFLCAGLLVMGLAAWLFFPALGKISFGKGFNSKAVDSNDSTHIQNAYAPVKERWAEFKIPKSSKFLKIVSNAMYYMSDKASFKYVVHLEILNTQQTVIYSNSYSQAGQVRIYKEKGSNRILSDPFLVDANKYLTKNYEIILPLQKLKEASILKLKWSSQDSELKNILLKVARDSESSKTNEENQWLRMPIEKKKEIAENSAFTYSDLDVSEIKNALSKKWRYLSVINENNYSLEISRTGYLPSAKLRSFQLAKSGNSAKQKSKSNIKSEFFKLYLESAGGTFKPPAEKNVKKAEALFGELFNLKEVDKTMIDEFNKLGFDLKEIKVKKNTYIIVYEELNHKDGKGFYVFCRNSKNKNTVLEMPHRFFDDRTGTIGMKLMFTGYYSAGAWNTVHRYQTPNSMPGSSDMAHNKRSFFHAFTRAFLKSSLNNCVMLQLHGFNEEKHKIGLGTPAAILSEGTNEPSPKFLKLSLAIKSFIQLPVLIHPYDNEIAELSAQGNVTGESFSKSESAKIFVHFEMNKLLRNKFLNSKEFVYSFSKNLNEAVEKDR